LWFRLWGRDIFNPICIRGFIFRMHKNLQKGGNFLKLNSQIIMKAKDTNREYIEKIQMWKEYSISLVMRKMQIKNIRFIAGSQWFTPAFLATWEAETGRIT
jgi:hypothetical protein